jgi:hypothetical protein
VQSEQDEIAVRTLLSFAGTWGFCRDWKTGVKYNDMQMPDMYRSIRSTYDGDVLYRSTPKEGLVDLAFRLRISEAISEVGMVPADNMIKKTAANSTLMHDTCSMIYLNDFLLSMTPMDCVRDFCGVICEIRTFNMTAKPVIKRSSAAALHDVAGVFTLPGKAPLYLVCPKAHLTHAFISCHTDNDCFARQQVSACPDPGQAANLVTNSVLSPASVMDAATDASTTLTNTTLFPTFQCGDSGERIHFTLVCDLWNDCRDKSDESFCQHPACPQLTCDGGRYVGYDMICDYRKDCLDFSDEHLCHQFKPSWSLKDDIPPGSLITLADGGFTVTQMGANESCPETHYRCVSEPYCCMPVFTRCNGFYDCLGREDELDCDNVTCPGFYRCRGSGVCVHPDDLCDGTPQCPKHDDEWLCGERPCPEECLCHGLSFVCAERFPATLFPNLRYLDGSGSGMTLSDFDNNSYIILVLVRCNLTFVSEVRLLNLRHLDLSHNRLVSVNMDTFLVLVSLRELSLANNPLLTLWRRESRLLHSALSHLDLSLTGLTNFTSLTLSHFASLQRLNLSHTDPHYRR